MTAGDLTIKPGSLKGVEYRFNITPNSTMKINKEKQLQELERYIDNMGKFQNMFKDDPRIEFHPDKISATFGSLADIQGADEFVTVNDGPSPKEQELMGQLEQMQQQMQQMQEDAKMKEMEEKMSQANQPELTTNAGGAFRDPDLAAAAEMVATIL
jgi:hypothetical protein